jgi:hypothetical protein
MAGPYRGSAFDAHHVEDRREDVDRRERRAGRVLGRQLRRPEHHRDALHVLLRAAVVAVHAVAHPVVHQADQIGSVRRGHRVHELLPVQPPPGLLRTGHRVGAEEPIPVAVAPVRRDHARQPEDHLGALPLLRDRSVEQPRLDRGRLVGELDVPHLDQRLEGGGRIVVQRARRVDEDA